MLGSWGIHHFLGINVHQNSKGLFYFYQEQYARNPKSWRRAQRQSYRQPVDTKSKVSASNNTSFPGPTHHRSIDGALQYLTLTCLVFSYVVQQCCLPKHDCEEKHYQPSKRIIRYLRGTMHLALQIQRFFDDDLATFSDGDRAGCPDTCKSTSCLYIFLGNNRTLFHGRASVTNYVVLWLHNSPPNSGVPYNERDCRLLRQGSNDVSLEQPGPAPTHQTC